MTAATKSNGKATRKAARVEAKAAGPSADDLDAAFGRLMLHYGRAYNACRAIEHHDDSLDRLREFWPDATRVTAQAFDRLVEHLECSICGYAAARAAAGFAALRSDDDEPPTDSDASPENPDAAFGRLVLRLHKVGQVADFANETGAANDILNAHTKTRGFFCRITDGATDQLFNFIQCYAASRGATPIAAG